jgi:4-oxalocrotonate tautomerase
VESASQKEKKKCQLFGSTSSKEKQRNIALKSGTLSTRPWWMFLVFPGIDRFQVITEHRKGALLFDRDYLGVHRSDDCIFFQITLNAGRSVELKQTFYRELTDRLHQAVKLRREDVFINLVEVPKENWSYGNGLAQYVSS